MFRLFIYQKISKFIEGASFRTRNLVGNVWQERRANFLLAFRSDDKLRNSPDVVACLPNDPFRRLFLIKEVNNAWEH